MTITNLKNVPIKEDEYKSTLDALGAHLAQGAAQAKSGNFVEDFSMDSLIQDLDKEVG